MFVIVILLKKVLIFFIMNPRLPYNHCRVPLPNSRARPMIGQAGPTKFCYEVPFDQDYGHFGVHLATRFHYFSVNTSAKIDQCYLPVEISIVEFSFKQGTIRSYHQFLEQNIPKGLSYDAILQQEKHRINTEKKGEAKMNAVFGEIVDFFNQSSVIVMFCEDSKLFFSEQNKHCVSTVKMYGITQLAQHFLEASGSTLSPKNLIRLMQKPFFDSYLSKQCHYHRILPGNLCTEDDAYKMAYAFIFAMAVIHEIPLQSLAIPNIADMEPFLEKIVQRFSEKN